MRSRKRGSGSLRARCGLWALGLMASGGPILAAVPPLTSVTELQVRPAAGPVSIDGRLEEEAWRQAARVALSRERYPAENSPSPLRTDCWVTFDEHSLYVAFEAADPVPEAIRAHLADRDRALDDDFVGIALDPFNDERRGFLFLVNPLGVQMDAAVNDVGREDLDLASSQGGTGTAEDFSWDAIWMSSGRLTDGGYVVEMAIPFSSLRFPRSAETQVWGFDAIRTRPRGERRQVGLAPLDSDRSCYLCQVAKLGGFVGMVPGRNLEVVPTVTTLRTDRRPSGGEGSPLTSGPMNVEPGLSGRWGITPNLIFNGTLNPDFSQVEADVAQLDVNTRFALFFPEKRPFFLEGNDLFTTPVTVVHTRTIADPSWGMKLSGKEGRHAVGAFVTDDAVTQLLIPGPQGSRSALLEVPSRDSVVRYRHDLGSASTLGLLLTDRDGGGYSSRLLGVDGLFRLSTQDTLRMQALESQTRYPGEIIEEFDQPSGRLSGSALHLDWTHRSREWHWNALIEDVGEGFRADLGFLPFVDYRWLQVGVDRVFWGGAEAPYTRWSLGGGYEQTRDQAGALLDRIAELRTTVDGPYQSRVHLLGRRVSTRFADRLFDLEYLRFELSARPGKWLGLGLAGEIGDGIDFVGARPGESVRLIPSLEGTFGRHLALELRRTFERLRLEEGELFRANLTELRAIYHLNVRTFVRLILQHTDVSRDPELFPEPVEERSRTIFSQLLFSYRLNSQTALLVGYSDRWLGGEGGGTLERSDRTFFLKVGYAWTL